MGNTHSDQPSPSTARVRARRPWAITVPVVVSALFGVAGLFADHVWRWVSSHVPLSYQSEPRVGTTISSVLTSETPQYSPSLAVFRSPAYTPASAASTSPSVW